MSSESPIPPYLDRVRPDWVDYNGHMSEAFYVLVFSDASDAFYDEIGLDAITRERSRSLVYALEAHVCYLNEVGEGAPLEVTTRVLDFDAKRAHVFHTMRHGAEGTLLATEELMLMHVDKTGPRATSFPLEVRELLRGLQEAQAAQPQPEQAGRVIGIRR
jgi:acyl-CoA thioester hydrolase